jgi:hypothetical protein
VSEDVGVVTVEDPVDTYFHVHCDTAYIFLLKASGFTLGDARHSQITTYASDLLPPKGCSSKKCPSRLILTHFIQLKGLIPKDIASPEM